MRGGMPSPGALRGEIGQLQSQKSQMESGASKMQSEIYALESQKAGMIKARQERIAKRAEIQSALNQIPQGHPQRGQYEEALANIQAGIDQINASLPQIDRAIEARRQQVRQLRERKTAVEGGIQARRNALIQITAQMMKQKQQQKKGVKQEQGKQKG